MEAPIMLLSGHIGEVYTGKFHPSGDILASSGFDRQIFLWKVYGECTGERIKRMKRHTSFVNSVDCSRGNKPLVVSGGDDCQVKVWDRRRQQPLSSLNSTYQVTAVQFSEDASQVVSAGIDNDINL